MQYLSAGGEWEVGLLKNARVLIVKFPSLREHERWMNLLSATKQTKEWRKFLFHLPYTDVLNILIARIFVENTRTHYLNDLLKGKVRKKIKEALNAITPILKGTSIELENLEIGKEIPLVTNVSDPVLSKTGDLHFDLDVLYRGGLSLTLQFDLTYRGIKVKRIAFAFQLMELSTRIRFFVGPPPSKRFFLGCLQVPQIELRVEQQEVQDKGLLHWLMKFVPNLSGFATNIVRDALFDDMTLPNMDDFPLPGIDDDEDDSGGDNDGNVGGEGEEGEEVEEETRQFTSEELEEMVMREDEDERSHIRLSL